VNETRSEQTLTGVFLGEESLLISCAQVWLDRGHEIRAVVSDVADVTGWAEENHLPVVGVADALVTLRGDEPFDYLFSIVNFKLLPEELLQLPRHWPINYHDSPLPAYAGVNATNWAIMNGEERHAITWHVMTAEVDAGPILEQRFFPISLDDTAITLNARAYEAALVAFRDLTDRLANGTAEPTEQPAEGRSYFARWMRPPAAGVIDWTEPATTIERLVRGLDHGSYLNPLGKAKLHLGDTVMAVTRVTADSGNVDQPAGTILEVGPTGFRVAAREGSVTINALESLSGEKLVPARVVERAGFEEGDRLPALDAGLRDALASAAAAYAPKERYWIECLVELELMAAPYRTPARPGAASGAFQSIQIPTPPAFLHALAAAGIDPGDGLAAAVLMYLARIHDRVEFDIGFRSTATSPPAGSEHLFAPYVPLRFAGDASASLDDFVRIFGAARTDVEARRTYALDLVGRTPRLRDAGGPFSPPLVIERTGREPVLPPVPVDLLVQVPDDGAALTVYSAQGAISDEDIERIGGQLATALSSLAADPEQALGEMTTLTEAEQSRLLYEWNPAGRSYDLPSSLATAFENQVEAEPSAIALTFLDEHMTYEELNRRANRVASILIEKGAGPNVLVGLAMDRSLDLLVGLLGILKSGSAYLPLDPAYPADRIRYMVEHAQAPLILTQRHLAASVPPSSSEVVLIEDVHGRDGNPPAAVNPDNLAYVMYTSGSTGRPKGVQITHRNVLRLMEATRPWFQFGSGDVWTLFHSYAFDFTVWEIWGALLFGGRLVIPTHDTTRSPREFRRLLWSEQVTVLNQTPSAFRQLIAADGATDAEQPLSLRYVVFGGEALDLADLLPWVARHGAERPQLVNMYGITETTVHVTYRPLTSDDIEQNLGSVIGVPIPDLQIYVLDRWMKPMPIGMPGEVYVAGAGLARGYLNRPDLTEERFLGNPFADAGTEKLYKTGDVARYLPSGDLEYLGRSDHQIQLRGFRVELGEIEAALAGHSGVSKAIVDVQESVSGEKALVAYYLSVGESVEPGSLRDAAAESLPEYMVPHHLVPLESLPLTPSGKLDRKALPPPSRQRVSTGAAVLPRNEAEEKIARVWEGLLDVTGVGVDESFFDLGGDSLSIVRANDELRALFDTELTMADMFRLPTVSKLAGYLTSAGDGGDEAIDEGVRLARQRRSARRARRS